MVSEEAEVPEEASEDDSEDQGDVIHLEGVSRYGHHVTKKDFFSQLTTNLSLLTSVLSNFQSIMTAKLSLQRF